MNLSNMNVKLDWKLVTIVALICFGLGALTGFILTKNFYKEKLNEVNTELTNFKAQYSTVIKEREEAIIAKALADQKAKTPVKEYVKGDTVTEIQYLPKESSSDADLSLTSKPMNLSFEYNGVKQPVNAVTSEGKQFVDGKWVITQQTQATLNVDDIVNRQIANKINEEEHDKAVLKRQKTQQTFWGTVIGVGIGSFLK